MNSMLPFLSVTHLEPYIDNLIACSEKLRRENQFLHEQLKRIEIEKTQLVAKNQEAITKLKQAISQLREEIHERSK